MFVGWRIFAIIETGRGPVMQRWRWLVSGRMGSPGRPIGDSQPFWHAGRMRLSTA
jgi:hypothetical protein